MGFGAEIPRACDAAAFRDDPLAFLARARAAHGDVFVLREAGPIFSRAPDCAGVIAAFGAGAVREVLGDIDAFGMPVSAAVQLALPPAAANLTRGLHSLRGADHDAQRGVVAGVLAAELAGGRDREALRAVVDDAITAGGWTTGAEVELLATMRALARDLAARVLFGAAHAEHASLIALLEAHFVLRREASAPGGRADDDLVTLATVLDAELRRCLATARRGAGTGIVGALARTGLPDDALVAHANVLFVSATEPIALALTWIALVLSQLPALRRTLRHQLAAPARSLLLDHVIAECLRLLPPNAMMVRITTRAATVAGLALPPRTEVVVCPFVAHRDEARFPAPRRFAPARWETTRPSSYEYFPFGAGGHACAGRALATALITAAVAAIVTRFELVLARDAELDWRIHIQLMPRTDPVVRLAPPGTRARGGRLRGAVGALLDLSS